MLNYAPDLDRVFQALADPGRRVMVERLSRGPASVSELGEPLDMSLAAVLQHVQVLEACGLISTRKLGRTRTCSINPVALRSAESWLAERRTLVERRLDRLGRYLAETAGQPDTGWPDEPGEAAGEPAAAAGEPGAAAGEPAGAAGEPGKATAEPGGAATKPGATAKEEQ
jgi:DNA-binding transcriptional ArsR family regulator